MKISRSALTDLRFFYGIAAVLLFALFVLSHSGLRYDISYPDSREYLYLREHASEGFAAWRHAFLLRPALIGIYFALMKHAVAAAWGQSFISFAAWLYLALAVAALVQRRCWARMVFIIFLGGALGRQILFWNVVPISESLSLSCLCFLLGAVLNHAAGRGSLVTVAIASLLLVLTRDIWNYWLLMLAPLLLLLPALRSSFVGGRGWRMALVLMLAATFGLWGAAKGERYVIPLKHAITHYVIGDEAAIEFFAQRGLLLPPLQQQQCRQQTYEYCTFDAAQEAWLREHGKTTYQSWLLQTLPQRTRIWATALPDALSRDFIPLIWSARNSVYDTASRLEPIGHIRFGYLALLGTVVVVMCVVAVRAKSAVSPQRQLLAQVGVGVMLSGVALLFVSFWADGVEVWRHLILPAILCSLGGWLALCAQIDAVLGDITNNPADAPVT